jgi:ABC-type dipeptide/oligopeptide/nickel transport system permease subunit
LAQSASELERGASLQVVGLEGVEARSPRQIFWMRFRKDKLAIFGAVLVILMVLLAILAPLAASITGHAVDEQFRGLPYVNDFGTPALGPSSEMWLGVDDQGRDLFVRIAYGARTSLTIAIIATGFEVVIGVTLGMLSGFLRGWVDTIVSRMIDLILSIPFLLLGIALGVSEPFGLQGSAIPILLITFFGWPYIARIIRGQTLSLRESQFVEAAYSLGAPTRWIMFKEILPNLVAPIIVYSTLIVPVNILAEASLSFLGIGVQEPTAAWGSMLDDATKYSAFGAAWWFMAFPGLALFLTVLGFNLLGDGLRDALDPRTKA